MIEGGDAIPVASPADDWDGGLPRIWSLALAFGFVSEPPVFAERELPAAMVPELLVEAGPVVPGVGEPAGVVLLPNTPGAGMLDPVVGPAPMALALLPVRPEAPIPAPVAAPAEVPAVLPVWANAKLAIPIRRVAPSEIVFRAVMPVPRFWVR